MAVVILPIPIVPATDIGDSVERFYSRFAGHPVIVRGCYPAGHPLSSLTLGQIQDLVGEVPIHVNGAAVDQYREVPASAMFAGVRGQGGAYKVVDFYIPGTPMGDLFEVPPFLRHNWFLGAPAHCDRYEKSLVLSPAGAYASLHLDSYAMQGWMFLIAGHKTWTCYGPECVAAAFHPKEKRFFHSRQDRLEDFPDLVRCQRWVGDIGAGDLLYFPAGWIHEVATHQISYGVGGSVLNDYQIEDHMRWWLWERDQQFEGSLDLKRVLEEMPEHRFSSDAGRERTRSALRLCAAWENRQNA